MKKGTFVFHNAENNRPSLCWVQHSVSLTMTVISKSYCSLCHRSELTLFKASNMGILNITHLLSFPYIPTGQTSLHWLSWRYEYPEQAVQNVGESLHLSHEG